MKSDAFEALRARRPHRVLELGPLDGRDTVVLAGICDELVCVEARDENIKRVKHLVPTAEVVKGNLEEFDLSSLGRFDAVFASGIIYHMPYPVDLMKQISEITRCCCGWTHLAEYVSGELDDYKGRWYVEGSDTMAGMSRLSWWLTPREFVRAWKDLGFSCFYLDPQEPHPIGGLEASFFSVRFP